MKMQLFQVKKYNENIAYRKYANSDKTKTVKSMFVFTLVDKDGYSTSDRKRGYVAFNEHKAVFGKNQETAIEKFNS